MTALEPETFDVDLNVTIRTAIKSDIPKLEWHGEYLHFRKMFQRAYEEQIRGRRLILIAEFDQFPIGHIFIQFVSNNAQIADGKERAYLYSFRVMENFRGKGIGTRLLQEAHTLLIKREFSTAVIAVAKGNAAARRLYERQGYRVYAQDPGRWQYTDHQGIVHHVQEPCWLLRKTLIA